MPPPVLLVLIVLVGTYAVLAGIASLGFILARQENSPPAPSEWPPVSVVVPPAAKSDQGAVEQIQACVYPRDRLELLVPAKGPAEYASRGDKEVTVRRTPVPDDSTGTPLSSALLEHAIEAAEEEIVLSMPAEGTVAAEWIHSMVRRCTPETPVVVGPTLVNHEDLFLPRLQALSHLGRLAFTVGASHFGLPSPIADSNRAVRTDGRPADETLGAVTERGPDASPRYNLEPDAAVGRPPAASFRDLFRHLVHGFRRSVHAPSWLVSGQGIALWLVHTALLTCALVAVALPAWRQPTLIVLVAKMGADVILTLPIATHYGQRGLFRSLVPTELMLVLALPLAGLWSLTTSIHTSSPHTDHETESP